MDELKDIIGVLGPSAGIVVVVYLFLRYFERKIKIDKGISDEDFHRNGIVFQSEPITSSEGSLMLKSDSELLHSDPYFKDYGGPVHRTPPYIIGPEIASEALSDSYGWEHDALGTKELHSQGILGEEVIVYVLDTGADANHPDLKDNIDRQLARDFSRSSTGWGGPNPHGTHCAGTIGAVVNGAGIVGIAPKVKIVPIKVLGDTGAGRSDWIAEAYDYIRSLNKPGILSNSYGAPAPDSWTGPALKRLIDAGYWFVAAAGNSGPGTVNWPGAYPEAICVGAIDSNLNRASFSSTNQTVDTCAPGVNIISTIPGGRYASFSGTSMATPCVSGVLALVWGELTKRGIKIPNQMEVIKAIEETSRDLGGVGRDDSYGWGLIVAKNLIKYFVDKHKPEEPKPEEPKPPIGNKEITWKQMASALKKNGYTTLRVNEDIAFTL